jgi:hypothetical protein
VTLRNAIGFLSVIVVLLFCSASALATNPQIDYLKSQQLGGTLLDNFKGDGLSRAYTYDQALAIIAFTKAGEKASAQAILNKMRDLVIMSPAGAPACWYSGYSYNSSNGVFSPLELKMYTGANAWMLQAINYYQVKTGDPSYADLAALQVSRMDALRLTTPSQCLGAYALGSEYKNSQWQTLAGVSTEHQDDVYAALKNRAFISGDAAMMAKANAVRDYIAREGWAPNLGSSDTVFWRGFDNINVVSDRAIATDCMSWSVLSQGALGPGGEKYYLGLDWLLDPLNTRSTLNTQYLSGVGDVKGFSTEYEVYQSPHPSVWAEGNEGVVAALRAAADDLKVTDPTRSQQYLTLANDFHGQTALLIGSDGGVLHSFSAADPPPPEPYPDNFRYESTAATAWYYFNDSNVNPLETIPEPATISMIAFGLLSLCATALKLRRK